MAELKLTAQQQAVVDSRGGALLVSAAAGSGKTKVLVDRLLGMVCDPDRPCDIHEFLIITYTKAAASELRAKISAELGKRLAADPTNRHLQRQMNLLYLTQISTVHAFCTTILREYSHLLSLPPDFRVGDEQTCSALRERALEDVLEDAYSHMETLEGLPELLDIIGSGRDDMRLGQIVLWVYEAVCSHPYPAVWIAQCRDTLDLADCADAGQTPWGAYLLERIRQTAERQLPRLESAIAAMDGYEKLEKAYVPVFRSMAEQVRTLAGIQSWDGMAAHAHMDYGRLGAVRNFEDPALQEQLKAVRERCKAALKPVLEPVSAPSSVVLEELRQSARALQALLTLVERFTDRYRAEKQRRSLVDFSDLEHETIGLLTTGPSGKPSQAARALSARYREVMVDEYQDSNAVQETIFEAISRNGKNRFLVGDVKQSIYRFRLADPSIFLEKYNRYPSVERAGAGEPRKILLSQNFRSDPQILDAVNFVFSAVMSKAVGDLRYGQAEALQPPEGKESAFSEPAVELHAIDLDLTGSDEEDAPDKLEVEAKFAAARIRAMLDAGELIPDGETMRPVQPGDVVILLRSLRTPAAYYVQALEQAGIPVTCDQGGNLFETPEAVALVSLLQIIDNPRRDVPLLCVLQSPLAGFTSDELAQARLLQKEGDYWEALQLFGDKSEKARRFLEQLEELRQSAAADTVTRLLDRIWQKTSISALYGAMDGGTQRVRNLEALYALSLGFEGTLMEFLETLETAREQGMAPPGSAAASDCVTIMSIHKSKGLEFPVVVLSDLSRRFNLEDVRQPVLVHPRLGMGAYVLDRETLVRYPTIARTAISMEQKKETVSEELRVLYVAMTRPKAKLIMTMCKKRLLRDIEKFSQEAALPMPEELAASASSLGDWILMAALCRTEAGALHKYGRPGNTAQGRWPWEIRLYAASDLCLQGSKSEIQPVFQTRPVEMPPRERVLEAMAYQYPYGADTQIPSKLTATQLKGRTLDQEAAENTASEELPTVYVPRPRFRQALGELTAAEKGTATHLVMQFADFAKCGTEAGVRWEIDRLVEQEYITQQQADAVHPARITAFFASDLGKRVLSAKELVREFKFSMLAPAETWYPGGTDEILLQGVVDCCLVEEDGLTILDFKTDRVTAQTLTQRAEYYRGQLDAYAAALEQIFEKPVKERILYFFHVDQAVWL